MATATKKKGGRPRASEAEKAEWQRKARELSRQNQASGRAFLNEVGEIPPPKNPERRAACENDFPLFCRTYKPQIFKLPWSAIHLEAADRIQTAVRRGGMFAYAMPRASGKTSQAEAAAEWAICYGHLSFVVLISASEPSAELILKSIKTTFRKNDMLCEDFPEICVPFRNMEGKPIKGANQTHKGNPTAVQWTKNSLVFPTIEGSKASGSVIAVRGLTGEIRGMAHVRQDGSKIRPQLAICDDPQTRVSAKSPAQSKMRSETILSDIAYLAGPDKPAAVLVPCTVIYRDDMADRLLDREQYPQFQGFRTRMVESFPTNTELWEEYEQILKSSLLETGNIEPATAFYREHQAEMDEGCEVTWPERMYPDEISAIQHAMNLKIRDEAAFWSEMQNEPVESHDSSEMVCSPKDVMRKVAKYPKFTAPVKTQKVTSYIDCQRSALYYGVCGWTEGFTGHLVDYNVWPDQRGQNRTFSLADLNNTFTAELGGNEEQHLYEALKRLVFRIVKKPYPVDGGDEIRVDRILIDAQAGDMRDTIYQFCREHEFGLQIDPAHGIYVGAASKPWSEYRRKRGEFSGPGWRYLNTEDWPIKHVAIDSNFWKTFIHRRMKADIGESGTFTIYGRSVANRPLAQRYHVDLADQFCAEYATETKGRNRTVHEWKLRAGTRENHFLDVLAGCAVGASMEGIALEKQRVPQRRTKAPRVSFAAQAARA